MNTFRKIRSAIRRTAMLAAYHERIAVVWQGKPLVFCSSCGRIGAEEEYGCCDKCGSYWCWKCEGTDASDCGCR